MEPVRAPLRVRHRALRGGRGAGAARDAVRQPLLPPALRLFGARIGRRTCVATTYLTEFDLVDIGDDAVVGRDVSLQTHLFEDRVMKMSTLRIGNGATVGTARSCSTTPSSATVSRWSR